jgi:hypothetical protein
LSERSNGRKPEVCRRPRDFQEPVFASGNAVGLDGNRPEDLAERDRHERVVDAALDAK